MFDVASNRTGLSTTVNGTADFVNAYTFDGLNRNTRLTQAAQGSGPGFNEVAEKRVDLKYTALGQFDLITRYASLDTSALVATSDYAYDSLARLDPLTHQRANSSVINSYDFGYDSLNRITSLNQAIDGLSSFSYDTTNQLTAADHATQSDENYSYDLNGNRTDAGNVAGAANRLLEDAAFVYEYDAEGNTIRQTRKATAAATDFITEFAWDHRNRLVEVTQKNNSGLTTVRVEYDYDVTDHMIGRREFLGNSSTPTKSEYFVWDGWNIALILDGAGAVVERRFNGDAADQVFASEDALNEVTWLLADHLNTPRDFLDSSGTLLNHRVYDSFGLITSETNSSVGTNIAFTGGYRDTVTNLVYRWHRWYSPHTHRWLSEDWIEDDLKNSYRYGRNSPIIATDSSGLLVTAQQLLQAAAAAARQSGPLPSATAGSAGGSGLLAPLTTGLLASEMTRLLGNSANVLEEAVNKGHITEEQAVAILGGVRPIVAEEFRSPGVDNSVKEYLINSIRDLRKLNFEAKLPADGAGLAGPSSDTEPFEEAVSPPGSGPPRPRKPGDCDDGELVDLRTEGLSEVERAAIMEYARRSNVWLSVMGPVRVKPTAGPLRGLANAFANAEKRRAKRDGKPYNGQPGHVPDTALTGNPIPPMGWLDMPGTTNQKAGGSLGARVGKCVKGFTVDGKTP